MDKIFSLLDKSDSSGYNICNSDEGKKALRLPQRAGGRCEPAGTPLGGYWPLSRSAEQSRPDRMAPLPAAALIEAMRAAWDDRRLKQGGTA